MIDHLLAVYHAVLVLARVPNVRPQPDGQILSNMAEHLIMPRIPFPEKADLKSKSEMGRK